MITPGPDVEPGPVEVYLLFVILLSRFDELLAGIAEFLVALVQEPFEPVMGLGFERRRRAGGSTQVIKIGDDAGVSLLGEYIDDKAFDVVALAVEGSQKWWADVAVHLEECAEDSPMQGLLGRITKDIQHGGNGPGTTGTQLRDGIGFILLLTD